MSVPQDVATSTVTANTAVTTTSEIAVITSPPVAIGLLNTQVCIYAWAQLTTGAGTTAVTPRIRQGSGTGGTLLSEANAVTIGAAAGSTEQFLCMAVDTRQGETGFVYTLTLQQTGASADGSCLQAGILVVAM